MSMYLEGHNIPTRPHKKPQEERRVNTNSIYTPFPFNVLPHTVNSTSISFFAEMQCFSLQLNNKTNGLLDKMSKYHQDILFKFTF